MVNFDFKGEKSINSNLEQFWTKSWVIIDLVQGIAKHY